MSTKKCVVCYDAFSPVKGITCCSGEEEEEEEEGEGEGEGHFLCGVEANGCASGVLRARGAALREVNQLAAAAAAASVAGDTRRASELGGHLHCPVPGCLAPAFSDGTLALQVSEEDFALYGEGKTLLPIARETASVYEQAQSALRAANADGLCLRARTEARLLLERQLKAQFPNARQCGRWGQSCSFTCFSFLYCRALLAIFSKSKIE